MAVLWTAGGRRTYLGKIGFFLMFIWLLTLIMSINYIWKQRASTSNRQVNNNDSEYLFEISN